MDPLDLINQYGADPLRFTLAAMAAQGRDIKMSTTRLETYRNFATKIWNACRFLEMNGCTTSARNIDLTGVSEPVNKWIISEYNELLKRHLQRLRVIASTRRQTRFINLFGTVTATGMLSR